MSQLDSLVQHLISRGMDKEEIADYLRVQGAIKMEAGEWVPTGRPVMAPDVPDVEMNRREKLAIFPTVAREHAKQENWTFWSSDIKRFVEWGGGKIYNSTFGRELDIAENRERFGGDPGPSKRNQLLHQENDRVREEFNAVWPGGAVSDGIASFLTTAVLDPANLIGPGFLKAGVGAVVKASKLSKIAESSLPMVASIGKKINSWESIVDGRGLVLEAYKKAGGTVPEVISGNAVLGAQITHYDQVIDKLSPKKVYGSGTVVFDADGEKLGKLLQDTNSSVKGDMHILLETNSPTVEEYQLSELLDSRGKGLKKRLKGKTAIRIPDLPTTGAGKVLDDTTKVPTTGPGRTKVDGWPPPTTVDEKSSTQLVFEDPSKAISVEYSKRKKVRGKPRKWFLEPGTKVYKKDASGKKLPLGELAESLNPYVDENTFFKVFVKYPKEISVPVEDMRIWRTVKDKAGKVSKPELVPFNYHRQLAEAEYLKQSHEALARDLGFVPLTDESITPAESFLRNPESSLGHFRLWAAKKFANVFSKSSSFPSSAAIYKGDSPPAEFLKRTMPQLFSNYTGEKELAMRRLVQNQMDLDQVVTKYSAKVQVDPEDVYKAIFSARTNKEVKKLPKDIRGQVWKSLNFIDELSERVILMYQSSSNVPAEEVEAISQILRENLGQYLHTRYGKHMTTNWWDRVKGSSAYDNLFIYLKATGDYQDSEIPAVMYKMATKDSRKGLARFSGFNKKEVRQYLTELKQQKELADVEKEFMGALNHGGLAIQHTGALLIHDLEVTAFKRQLMKEGLEAGLFSTKPLGSIHPAEIIISDIDAPVYGSKVTKEFFDEAFNSVGSKVSVYRTFNGFIKGGLILLNPHAHTRNFISASLSALGQGVHADPVKFAEALKVSFGANIKEEFKQFPTFDKVFSGLFKDSESLDRFINGMVKNNLFRQGAHTSEMRNYTRAVAGYLTNEPSLRNLFEGIGSNIPLVIGPDNVDEIIGQIPKYKEVLNKVITVNGLATAAFNIEDDLVKGAVWAVRKNQIEWALSDWLKPGQDIKDLPQHLQDIFIKAYGKIDGRSIESIASNIIKDCMQHYKHGPRLAQAMSQHSIISPFVTFSFEMPRNLYHMVRHIGIDLELARTVSPKFYAIAGAKIVGLTKATQAASSLRKAVNRGLDPQDQADFNRYLALPWDSNGENILVGRDGTKRYYRNVAWMDPWSGFTGILKTLVKGGFKPEAIKKATEEAADLYLAIEPLAGKLFEVALGKKLKGNIIEDLFENQQITTTDLRERSLAKRAAKAAGDLSPSVITNVKDLMSAVQERKGGWGVLDSITLPKLTEVDTVNSLASHMRNLEDKRKELGELPPNKARAEWARYNKEALKMVDFFKNDGMEYNDYLRAVRGESEYSKVYVNRVLAKSLWDGEPVEYDRIMPRPERPRR